MTDRTATRALIRGRVQGVSFRAWTEEEATRRGLSGWVRNREDGAVEAEFSGPAGAVEDMISACRRGPPAARVDDIETEAVDPPADHGEFRVIG